MVSIAAQTQYALKTPVFRMKIKQNVVFSTFYICFRLCLEVVQNQKTNDMFSEKIPYITSLQ